MRYKYVTREKLDYYLRDLQSMNKQEALELERALIIDAWELQNACNLSGVAMSFGRAMEKLCMIQHVAYDGTGTKWKNEHIVSKLYASKIAQLAGDLPSEHWVYEHGATKGIGNES